MNSLEETYDLLRKQVSSLQTRIKEHNEHHLALAKERDDILKVLELYAEFYNVATPNVEGLWKEIETLQQTMPPETLQAIDAIVQLLQYTVRRVRIPPKEKG